jgi:hypothetical protein
MADSGKRGPGEPEMRRGDEVQRAMQNLRMDEPCAHAKRRYLHSLRMSIDFFLSAGT